MPDTLNYMIAGYAVFWVVTFVFMLSLWLRTRNLQKEVSVLEQLVEGERHPDE